MGSSPPPTHVTAATADAVSDMGLLSRQPADARTMAGRRRRLSVVPCGYSAAVDRAPRAVLLTAADPTAISGLTRK